MPQIWRMRSMEPSYNYGTSSAALIHRLCPLHVGLPWYTYTKQWKTVWSYLCACGISACRGIFILVNSPAKCHGDIINLFPSCCHWKTYKKIPILESHKIGLVRLTIASAPHHFVDELIVLCCTLYAYHISTLLDVCANFISSTIYDPTAKFTLLSICLLKKKPQLHLQSFNLVCI